MASILVAAAAIFLIDASWTPAQSKWLFGEQGIAKVAIGSFLGAALAFASARRHDYDRKRQENLGAVRVAMAALGEQLTDFVEHRHTLRNAIHDSAQQNGEHMPLWSYASPMHHSFNMDAKVDIGALGFLFEIADRGKLIPLLSLANRQHVYRAYIAEQLLAGSVDIEKARAAAVVDPAELLQSVDDIRKLIGPALAFFVSDMLVAALKTVEEQSQTVILKAAEALRRATFARYPEATGIPQMGIPPQWPTAELPPIPRVFIESPDDFRY